MQAVYLGRPVRSSGVIWPGYLPNCSASRWASSLSPLIHDVSQVERTAWLTHDGTERTEFVLDRRNRFRMRVTDRLESKTKKPGLFEKPGFCRWHIEDVVSGFRFL